MPAALVNHAEIELLIEGERNYLFQKLTGKNENTVEEIDRNSSNYSFFNVLNVYPSKHDDSELILEVEHCKHKFYYYIFKFNGYLCCPAFLVKFFKLTDYACLIFRNFNDYYYVFLNEKEDNPSSILDDTSKLIGDYHFNLPKDDSRDKLHVLKPSNKDRVFIKSLDDMKADITPELISFYKIDDGKLFYTSKVDSYYRFPRKALCERLERKYGKLFSRFGRYIPDEDKPKGKGIYVGPIVFGDSDTYSELFKLGCQGSRSKLILLGGRSPNVSYII